MTDNKELHKGLAIFFGLTGFLLALYAAIALAVGIISNLSGDPFNVLAIMLAIPAGPLSILCFWITGKLEF